MKQRVCNGAKQRRIGSYCSLRIEQVPLSCVVCQSRNSGNQHGEENVRSAFVRVGLTRATARV